MAIVEFQFGPQNYVEQEYVDNNYTGEGSSYFLLTVEPNAIQGVHVNWRPYVDEGYAEGFYFASEGVQTGLTVDWQVITPVTLDAQTLAVSADVGTLANYTVGAEVVLAAAFSPTIQINATRQGDIDLFVQSTAVINGLRARIFDITLDSIVNQSLQADWVRGFTSTLSSQTSLDSTLNATLDNTADFASTTSLDASVSVIRSTSADFDVATTLSVDPLKVVDLNVDLLSEFTADIYAISYTVTLENNRPNNFVVYEDNTFTVDTNPSNERYDTSNPYDGTASARLSNGRALVSDIGYQIQSSDDFAFETWVRLDDKLVTVAQGNKSFVYVGSNLPSNLNIEAGRRVEDSDGGFAVGRNSAGKLVWFFGESPGAGTPRVTSQDVNEAIWFHIAVTRTNGVVKLFYNNVQLDSITSNYTFNTSYGSNTNYVALLNRGYDSFYDNTSLRIGASDILGYNQSITQDENTYVVATFENTLADSTDLSFVREYSADLTTTATLAANVGILYDNASNLTSEFTLNAASTEVTLASAALTTSGTLTATVRRLRAVVVDVYAESTLAASVGTLEQGASSLNITSTFVGAADRLRGVDADFNTAFDITTLPSLTVGANALLSAEFELLVDTGQLKYLEADLAADFELTADGGLLINAQSDLSVDATVDVLPGLLQDATTSLTVDATLNATAQRLRASTANFNADFTLDAAIDKFVNGQVDLTGQFDITTNANFTVDSPADLAVDSDLTALAGIVVDAASALSTTATLNVAISQILVDRVVYTVPREPRVATIVASDRYYAILNETRSAGIHSESRAHTIHQETRTYSLQGEDQ